MLEYSLLFVKVSIISRITLKSRIPFVWFTWFLYSSFNMFALMFPLTQQHLMTKENKDLLLNVNTIYMQYSKVFFYCVFLYAWTGV